MGIDFADGGGHYLFGAHAFAYRGREIVGDEYHSTEVGMNVGGGASEEDGGG